MDDNIVSSINVFNIINNKESRTMNIDNLVFIGLKLTEASIDKLKSYSDIKYENVFCDHITLWYLSEYNREAIKAINDEDADQFGYGNSEYQKAQLVNYHCMEESKCRVLFKATGILHNDICQTVTVSHVNHLMYNDNEPHVTLSTAGDTKPAYSNVMLYNAMYDGQLREDRIVKHDCTYTRWVHGDADDGSIMLEGYVKFYYKDKGADNE